MNENLTLNFVNIQRALAFSLPGFLVAGGAVWLGLGGVCGVGLWIVDRGRWRRRGRGGGASSGVFSVALVFVRRRHTITARGTVCSWSRWNKVIKCTLHTQIQLPPNYHSNRSVNKTELMVNMLGMLGWSHQDIYGNHQKRPLILIRTIY